MNAPALILMAALAQTPAQAPAPTLTQVLTLEQVLQEAQANNPDLQVARARLEQAQLLSRKAWANYLPQISAGGSYTRNNAEAKLQMPTGYYIRQMPDDSTGGPPFDPTKLPSAENPPGAASPYIMFPSGYADMTIQGKNQVGAQIQLQQALIVPALWPAIQSTYLAEKVVDLNVENARRELLFAVAQLYYGAATLKETVAVQKRLLANNEAHERDAKVRFEAGTVPKIQLVRAQIDTARAEQDVRRAENSYASAKVALATLLSRDDANFEVQAPEPPAPPEGSPEDLVAKAASERLDVLAANKSIELAKKGKQGALAKYLPNLFLTGAYRWANVKGFTGESTSWNVGLALSWNLFDGGLREAELKEHDSKIVEAKAARRSAELKARDEVLRSIIDLESAQANRVKAEEQLKLAQENTQLVRVNFNAGVATQLDVSDASAMLAGAEMGVVAETLNAELAALRLAKAAGAFDPAK
ncbi:MAG TPA: TolC family protein [Myxococcales bacterium]|nr:TolC family protein [Myxococcales bacterium]